MFLFCSLGNAVFLPRVRGIRSKTETVTIIFVIQMLGAQI
jgi:hypothetical protein